MDFQKCLSTGEFVILAQMNTPKGVNVSEMVNNARRIKGRIHAVVIPDMDNGVMRMSALAGGAIMRQQGLEPIIHVYARDRNRMALQGDLLAAHVLGVQALVVVRGEDMSQGDHVNAKCVDDLDEISLFGAIRCLQNGVDIAGSELNGNPSFTVGCTIRPSVDEKSLDSEIEAARKMVEAGARFILCPPVFDVDRFSTFAEKAKGLGAVLIPTVFLLKTVGIARYMATYEPGAFIPEHLIKRMRQAKNREMEGFVIAGETIKHLKSLAGGVQIVTLGWEHRLSTILDYAEI
ncbi:MAG: 5,10-methylenetetrahydrofolate reductase [Deltaproteobacteria bacterium HGW-Deltaproteobacteria-15]|nr:MAG: 5,10-methylenetetrahydrofolate reductase [Deltaproteobacteria bacterium HGW-Deltaproteobacteria-15]